MDRRPNALVSSAPADIPRHAIVNVSVRRMRFRGEQGNRLHNLSGLAVAALRNVDLLPGLLHGMALRRNTLNGGDVRTFQLGHLGRARPDGLAILQYGARAA